MTNLFDIILNRIREFKRIKPENGVAYSLKKYRDTYKLLEEYDQKAIRDPKKLADPGRLEDFIRDVQKSHRRRRAHSGV